MNLPSRGRPGLTLSMTVVRELTPQDLLRLSTDADIPRVGPPVLQRLRASHHEIAQRLARGESITEVAFAVGRTPQRVGDLTRDPTFQGLMLYYQSQREELAISDIQRNDRELVEIGQLARDEILDRLEDPAKRNQIPVGELRQLMGDSFDRTIAPRKIAQQNIPVPAQITFNIGTRDLRPKIIEGEVVVPASPTEDQDDDR